MFYMPVSITVLSCWAENCSLENWHHEDDINEQGELRMMFIEKIRWVLVWLWFMLCIKLFQFHFWFQFLVTFFLLVFLFVNLKKCRPLHFGILTVLLFLLAAFSVVIFCTLQPVPSEIADRRVRSFGGYLPPSQGPHNHHFATMSLQGLRRKHLSDQGVSTVPPTVLPFWCFTSRWGSIQSTDRAK